MIVVGGGSSGAVIAARLSETRPVLLLEAGPDFPHALPWTLANRRQPVMDAFDWGYRARAAGRLVDVPRGKVIGGSSTTNGAVALRGMPADYDEWNIPGWGWDDLLPVFKALEADDSGGPHHGTSGPLPIQRPAIDDLDRFHRAFLDACRRAGFPTVADHNDPVATGAGPIPLNIQGEVRVSTALAYLAPARSRPTLTVRGDAEVDRLIFDHDRACGVVLTTGEEIRDNGVVLAAGAYGSPTILLRSGIGPAEDLTALGIPVRIDRPAVGAGLQDHPVVGIRFRPIDGAVTAESPVMQTLLRCSPAGEHEPNLVQIFPFSRAMADRSLIASFAVALHKPRSTGTLRLASADPRVAPDIDLGVLTDPIDLHRLREAYRIGWAIATSREMAGVVELTEDVPADLDDATLNAYILARVATAHHPVGTARMGTDADAVVDPALRVREVDGLWAADASILPTVPRANTNLTCILVGEQAAALIGAA